MHSFNIEGEGYGSGDDYGGKSYRTPQKCAHEVVLGGWYKCSPPAASPPPPKPGEAPPREDAGSSNPDYGTMELCFTNHTTCRCVDASLAESDILDEMGEDGGIVAWDSLEDGGPPAPPMNPDPRLNIGNCQTTNVRSFYYHALKYGPCPYTGVPGTGPYDEGGDYEGEEDPYEECDGDRTVKQHLTVDLRELAIEAISQAESLETLNEINNSPLARQLIKCGAEIVQYDNTGEPGQGPFERTKPTIGAYLDYPDPESTLKCMARKGCPTCPPVPGGRDSLDNLPMLKVAIEMKSIYWDVDCPKLDSLGEPTPNQPNKECNPRIPQ